MNAEMEVFLKPNKLFENINFSELDFSKINPNTFSLKQGNVISKQDLQEKFFFLVEGEIHFYGEKKIILKENDFFPFSFLLEEEQKGKAVARYDSFLFSIDKQELILLVEQNPKIKENILKLVNSVSEGGKETEKSTTKEIEKTEIEYQFDSRKAARLISKAMKESANVCSRELEFLISQNEIQKSNQRLQKLQIHAKSIYHSVRNSSLFLEVDNDFEFTKVDFNSTIESFKTKFLTENTDLLSEIELNLGKTCSVKIDTKKIYEAIFQIIKNSSESSLSPLVEITTNLDAGKAEIFIKDFGSGIKDENVRLIFDPFTTFQKENHIGLGLAIADKIIEKHNGKLAVKSTSENGTIISIVLPIAN